MKNNIMQADQLNVSDIIFCGPCYDCILTVLYTKRETKKTKYIFMKILHPSPIIMIICMHYYER